MKSSSFIICCYKNARYADLNSSMLEDSTHETYGFLTKGDNSPLDDTVLYPLSQRYLYRSDIVGSVKGSIPHVGQLALFLGEITWFKHVMLVMAALWIGYEFR